MLENVCKLRLLHTELNVRNDFERKENVCLNHNVLSNHVVTFVTSHLLKIYSITTSYNSLENHQNNIFLNGTSYFCYPLLPGARRFVTLDFGRPVLLTDVLIPTCSDLASLSIDIWTLGEEVDGRRLVVATDISTHSLILHDLLPPPVCRFMKVCQQDDRPAVVSFSLFC